MSRPIDGSYAVEEAKMAREAQKAISARQAECLGMVAIEGFQVSPGVLDDFLMSHSLGHLVVAVLPERIESTMVVEALQVQSGQFSHAA